MMVNPSGCELTLKLSSVARCISCLMSSKERNRKLFIGISLQIWIFIPMNNTTTGINVKKAYSLYMDNLRGQGLGIENMLEAATCLGIIVDKKKALDPRNRKVLSRSNFWANLKYKYEMALKTAFIEAMVQSGQLYIDREFYSDEGLQVVTAISGDKFTVRDVNGRHCASHNPLLYPFDMSVLPGDDTEGE